jgi:hypothetical protein
MARLLTKLTISEISSAREGAGDGVKVVLMKRHAPPPGRYSKFFEGIDFEKLRTRKANPIRDDMPAAQDAEAALHPKLEAFVAAVLEAAPTLSREEAIRFLLHTHDGRATARHLAEITKTSIIRKEEPTMDRMETLRSFVKSDGITGIAKHIVQKGGTGVTEAEFSDLIMEAAKRERRAGESDASAFARLFENPANVDLRRAYAITKSTLMDIQPVQVGGADVSVNDSGKAYDQLVALAEEQRRRSPTLTDAQAFARAFEANPELAAKAHRRPSAADAYR